MTFQYEVEAGEAVVSVGVEIPVSGPMTCPKLPPTVDSRENTFHLVKVEARVHRQTQSLRQKEHFLRVSFAC